MIDPIAQLLTIVANARMSRLAKTKVPYSKFKESILEILKTEGFIDSYKVKEAERSIDINMSQSCRPFEKIKMISKPGKKMYAKAKSIPVSKGGYGLIIMSTPQGVLTGEKARKTGVGGEIICEVF